MQNLEQILSQTIALDCFSLCAEKVNGIFTTQSRSIWIPTKTIRKIVLDDGTMLYRFGTAIEIRAAVIRNSGPNGWERIEAIDKVILLTNNRRCSGKRIKAMAV